ncbi:hypothetical protein [Rhodobaculum claviforme]|uniref:hypothetical protein n=1 Tax=Rhodobaculum claviforme TaxID=1549854 RepID=UPI0019121B2A|nr:hypothetical protein [Rhodobaculum claviforme]
MFDLGGHGIGLVGCAVGASFAALVAQGMFAFGCDLPISIASSGQITPQGFPTRFTEWTLTAAGPAGSGFCQRLFTLADENGL